LIALAAACTAASAIGALAQAQGSGQQYVVTYIEAGPKEAAAARKLLAAYRDAAVKAPGIVQFDALQRINTPSHFAIVEAWDNAKAQEDFAASEKAKAFRTALTPLLAAPYDERKHTALSVGAKTTGAGAIYAVTHVDIIPTKKDEGVASVKNLADKSRTATGAIRYDALTQSSRPNHMTIVETWRSPGDKTNFVTASQLKSFRDGLLPMSGSLYDERLYRIIK